MPMVPPVMVGSGLFGSVCLNGRTPLGGRYAGAAGRADMNTAAWDDDDAFR
ncbi:MAG: hypothetical protein H0U35_04440 [Sporichthyaceae bacterium]|nr:hypothetical protein [Sporichthyaceae bacterium]